MDKELLLKSRITEAEVEIPGVGTVRVRGLTRDEVIGMRKAADNDPDTLDGRRQLVIERKMIATAMLDPVLTEADVGQWQINAPAGELDPVTDKISELSGMKEGASKSGVADARAEPGPGVRALPGEQAGHDGGDAPGADEQ